MVHGSSEEAEYQKPVNRAGSVVRHFDGMRLAPASNTTMRTIRFEVCNVASHLASPWSQMKELLVEWRQRAGSRRELARFDDAALADIGMSRGTAIAEAAKPFWIG
jgi:uncharacterized protein YjiS (DUF1127 family)